MSPAPSASLVVWWREAAGIGEAVTMAVASVPRVLWKGARIPSRNGAEWEENFYGAAAATAPERGQTLILYLEIPVQTMVVQMSSLSGALQASLRGALAAG